MVGLLGVAHRWIDPEALRLVAASGLVAFGVYKLLAPLSHPRWVGMRVSARDLTAWSFLMATAHGAELMLVPILLRLPTGGSAEAVHAAHAAHVMSGPSHAAHAEQAIALTSGAELPVAELLATGVHTAAMFLVMAAVALLVFEKVGLSVLRRAWFNVDQLWAGALVAAGVLTFLV